MIDLFYHPRDTFKPGTVKIKERDAWFFSPLNSAQTWTWQWQDHRALVNFTRKTPDNRSSIMVLDWVQQISKISRFLLEGARTLLVDQWPCNKGFKGFVKDLASCCQVWPQSSVKNIIAQLVKLASWPAGWFICYSFERLEFTWLLGVACARQQHFFREPILFGKRFELNCKLFFYNFQFFR